MDESIEWTDEFEDYLGEICLSLPIARSDMVQAQEMFIFSVKTKDISAFNEFIAFVDRDNHFDKYDFKDPQKANLRNIKMIWLRHIEDKVAEIFKVFRYNFRVFEDHHFYLFCLKIFSVIDYLSSLDVNEHYYRKNAIDSISELFIIKSQVIENFFVLFNNGDTSEFVDSLYYFYTN